MARLDRVTNRARLATLRVYRGAERTTDATMRRMRRDLRTVIRPPTGAADVAAQLTSVDRLLRQQRALLTTTLSTALIQAGTVMASAQAARAHYVLRSMGFVRQMEASARTAVIAGQTVGSRITSLVGVQRDAVRTILTQALQRGTDRSTLLRTVEEFYKGSTGNGGPAYLARRLVTSEITRFSAKVEVETGRQIYRETKQIPVYTFVTQGDDRVRDEHAALYGTEYTLDEFAATLNLEPVSKAETVLSDPNCRCFLASSFRAL